MKFSLRRLVESQVLRNNRWWVVERESRKVQLEGADAIIGSIDGSQNRRLLKFQSREFRHTDFCFPDVCLRRAVI